MRPAYHELPYGFQYGSARVERITSDSERGWVIIGVTTNKGKLDVYCTRTGKLRVYLNGKELRDGSQAGI